MNTNSEWGIYVEPDKIVRKYFCEHCGVYSGFMHFRICIGRENDIHKEYKIVCEKCSKTGPLHWSKNLAEHSWKAQNPNLNQDYISKSLDEMTKKG